MLWTYTGKAGEDQNASTCQFHAVTLADGKIAATNAAAGGILQNKPKSGEFQTVIYLGESEARVGGTIAKGDLFAVTTSGWLTKASSGGTSVGRSLAACASGGIVRGLFNFLSPSTVGSY